MTAVSWIFGFAGILANMVIFHQKNRKDMLTVKLFADIFWTLHYGFLFAWSGAAICGIGILRETVFINKKHKWAQSRYWLAVFLLCSILSAVLTWQNIFSILPACASVLAIVSFWIGKPRLTRFLQLPISIAFLTYDVVSGSYTGIISEMFTLLSLAFALFRFERKEKQ